MEKRFRIGVISSTHGVRGEVKVFPTTEDKNRFKKLKQVILNTEKEEIQLEVEGVKFFKQFVILKFKGYNDINEMEKYKGGELYVERKDAIPLKKDEYYIADLIGLSIEDERGEKIGVLKDVIQTGANDVYVISREEEKDLLLPAIRDCILKIDLEANIMKVHVLDGLLDL